MAGQMTGLRENLECPVPKESSDDERLVEQAPQSLGMTKGMVDEQDCQKCGNFSGQDHQDQ